MYRQLEPNPAERTPQRPALLNASTRKQARRL